MNRRRNDDGVFAILYALLVVVLITMVALVVDLGMLRADKRDARNAADTGALAGAVDLGNGPYNPYKACNSAWTNTWISLNVPQPTDNPCDSLSTKKAVYPCPTDPFDSATVSADAGQYTWRFTWPILEGSSFLTSPDGLTSGTRASNADFDGSDPCWRLAVQVFHRRQTGLGAIAGITAASTGATSVAKYTFSTGPGTYNYPLVVLNQHNCNVLQSNGSANIVVKRSALDENVPGRIAVDSDGTQSCNGKYILNVNGSTGFIQAIDGADAGINPDDKSSIEIFNKVGPGPPANSVTGVSTCSPATSETPLAPCVARIVRRPQRVTRAPFDATFGPAVSQLDSAWSTYSGSSVPTGWTLISGSKCKGPAFRGVSTIGYIVDCSASIDTSLMFPTGAPVVVPGNLKLGPTGCFAMNVSPAYVGPCSTYAPSDSALLGNAILMIRGSVDASGSGAGLILPGTFVRFTSPTANFNGSSFEVVYWTAPFGIETTMGLVCKTFLALNTSDAPPVDCFRNLAFWSNSSGDTIVKGGGGLALAGSFFLGNSDLTVGGAKPDTDIAVQNSQFIADTVLTAGGKPLIFVPNPDRTTPISRTGVNLIR